MVENVPYIPVDMLRSFMKDVLLALGVPAGDAETCTDVIIRSDMRGIESHGIGRLKYYYDRIKAGQHKGMAPTSVLEPMVLLYRLTGRALAWLDWHVSAPFSNAGRTT